MKHLLQILKSYLVVLVIFTVIDMVWLTLVARDLYQRELGHLMAPEVQWGAAGLFYLGYIAAMLYFAIGPALKANQPKLAALNGGALGLICYATYDLTNLATLKEWPVLITAIDLVWGTSVTAVTCLISYYLLRAKQGSGARR